MTMPELAVSKKECEEFARDHLRACVLELMVWQNTRLRPEGALRQLQLQCASWAGESSAFEAAEAVVVHECLRKISRG
jgi:hypothetical protein